MPHHDTSVTVTGDITHIFAHRFVVQTAEGPRLADLGPKGAERVTLRPGDNVEIMGEAKPSEVKVRTITIEGRTTEVRPATDHDDRDEREETPVDLDTAKAAVAALGQSLVGEARRKKKHLEVLARDAAGQLYAHHVHRGGEIRSSKLLAEDEAAALLGAS